MEPRSFDRGDHGGIRRVLLFSHASMEPRSFDRGDKESEAVVESLGRLQWSRGLLTAETRSTGRAVANLRTASMEPRSFDRGDQVAVALVPLSRPLQWSRGLLTAETTCLPFGSVSTPPRFNGAAVF